MIFICRESFPVSKYMPIIQIRAIDFKKCSLKVVKLENKYFKNPFWRRFVIIVF